MYKVCFLKRNEQDKAVTCEGTGRSGRAMAEGGGAMEPTPLTTSSLQFYGGFKQTSG